MREYVESNRALWNEWAKINYSSDFYDVDGFKAGRISLKPFEIEEVGDVSGKTLLHLQCHFGMDTISWGRLGANVTGVDFSQEAVGIARGLAAEVAIEARFICSDLIELPEALDETFDVVYTSFGALTWIPDIEGWAKVAARFVAPGGFLYVAEFHPITMAFEETDVTEPLFRYPYFGRSEPRAFPVRGSYADRDAKTISKFEYDWTHGLGEIVTAIIQSGLSIEFLNEFPFSSYPQFPFFERSEDGYWRLPASFPGEMPLLFSLRASKQ